MSPWRPSGAIASTSAPGWWWVTNRTAVRQGRPLLAVRASYGLRPRRSACSSGRGRTHRSGARPARAGAQPPVTRSPPGGGRPHPPPAGLRPPCSGRRRAARTGATEEPAALGERGGCEWIRASASMLVPAIPTRQCGTAITTSSTIASGACASRSYVSGIAPASEFSIGRTPHDASPRVTARMTSSKLGRGSTSCRIPVDLPAASAAWSVLLRNGRRSPSSKPSV